MSTDLLELLHDILHGVLHFEANSGDIAIIWPGDRANYRGACYGERAKFISPMAPVPVFRVS